MNNNLFNYAGMADFSSDDDEEEYFTEGNSPGKGYFDAFNLPDAPVHQRVANGTQTYALHIAFPSQEELVRALHALTFGDRKSIAASAKEGTINGIAKKKKTEFTFLEHWENVLLAIPFPIEEPKFPDDPNEAQVPV